MLYFLHVDVYSIGIFGGGPLLGALECALDHIHFWTRDADERSHAIAELHDFSSRGILDFDYSCGGHRRWHEFSVA